uniref:Tyrosine-protein phosphatase domain-containing protein n=1 Tax=Ditylenchus dipsaci TaxID=166011 RepID=A0A915D954_9BILA
MQNWKADKSRKKKISGIEKSVYSDVKIKISPSEAYRWSSMTQPSTSNAPVAAGQRPKKRSPVIKPLQRRERMGTRSVPIGTTRGSSRHPSRHNRTIHAPVDTEDSQDSMRTRSASLQPMLSALTMSSAPEKDNSQTTTDTEETAPEVNVEAIRRLEEFANAAIRRPFDSIVKEFTKKISSIDIHDSMCIASKQNEKKNRYRDIVCLDSTRVILRDPDGEARRAGNYIHANYVSSDELRATYILAQGPKKETVVDFWHMVWQVQCPVIIMLCDNTENGKKKCVQYIPPSYTTVQVPSSSGKMTIRASDGKVLKVKHWKWVEWGDFSVPREFQTWNTNRSGGLLGCFADRSGTYIMNCVEIVRRQRAHSVQTSLQYMFLYRALLEMSAVNDVVTLEQIKDFRLAYEKMAKKNQ